METFALSAVYSIAVPAAVVFAVVFLATRSGKTRTTSLLHDLVLVCVLVSATLSGIVALFYLPTALLGITSEPLVFGIRLALGVLLILGGLFLPNKIQKYFLLSLGLFMVAIEVPYVFTNFGSYGALLIVGIAFFALIGVTIWLSLRGKNE